MENAVRVRHPFRTDRGPRRLDAWSLQISETLAPVIVVDVDVDERARMWPLPSDSFAGSSARRLDGTDTRFRYTFAGPPQRYTDYDGAEVTVGDTAVAVAPRATEVRSDGMTSAFGGLRHVEVRLPTPLGSRVLVDHWGNPIEVLDE